MTDKEVMQQALEQPVQEQQQAEPPPEWLLIKNILDEYGLQAIDFVAEFKAAQQVVGVTHCQCEACKNGNIHDSDCSVHNGDALPVGPCDCSQTFISSPDLGIVVTVSHQLAVRELAKLVENNFGQMPRNDEWADKVLLVRDTFEAAHNIKEQL